MRQSNPAAQQIAAGATQSQQDAQELNALTEQLKQVVAMDRM